MSNSYKRLHTILLQFPLLLILFSIAKKTNGQILIEFRGSEKNVYTYRGGDEFNGSSLDRNKWMTAYPWARHLYCSMDVNYYSDGDDLQINDGKLSITARKSKITARAIPYESDSFLLSCPDKPTVRNLMNYEYQSGLIYSSEKYTNGIFEMRFKTDVSAGLWPAFWLFGADNQEIDIFEMGGNRKSTFHVDVHCKSGCKNYPVFLGLFRKNWGDYLTTTANWEQDYHTIGVDWRTNGIIWYLDGLPVAWWKGIFNEPLALIANLAVTNKEGSLGGAVSSATVFPASFNIDYIRIWQKEKDVIYKLPAGSNQYSSQKISAASMFLSESSTIGKKRPEYNRKMLKTPVQRIAIFRTDSNQLLFFTEGNMAATVHLEIIKEDSTSPYQQIELKKGVTSAELAGNGSYTIKVKCAKHESAIRIEVL